MRSHGPHLLPAADGDPGVIFGCGHKFVSGLHYLSVDTMEIQLANYTAEQYSGHCVGKSAHKKSQRGGFRILTFRKSY